MIHTSVEKAVIIMVQSGHTKNSEVLWLDVELALTRDDVPELTKKMIECAMLKQYGLRYEDYKGNDKHAPYTLYAASTSSLAE